MQGVIEVGRKISWGRVIPVERWLGFEGLERRGRC